MLSSNAKMVALCVFLLGTTVHTAHASGTKTNTTVTAVQTAKDAIFITLASGQSTGDNCSGGETVAIIPNASGHTAFAQEVSVVMAAFLSGRKVDVWIEGCASSPSGGDSVPFIKYFQIK
jgi:hypothetical protein